MPKNIPDSTPAAIAPEAATETNNPAKTSDAIRAALRNKTNDASARSRSNPYGADQKPQPAPYGTRRSMGKR